MREPKNFQERDAEIYVKCTFTADKMYILNKTFGKLFTKGYLDMSFRAYIIGKLDKGKLQIWLYNTAFSQNRMQGSQVRVKLINPL